MPDISQRLLFWDKQLSTLRRFTPRELTDSFTHTFKETISERTFKEDLKTLRDERNAPLKNKRFDNRNESLDKDEKSHYYYDEPFSLAPKISLTTDDKQRIERAIAVLKQFQHLPPLKELESFLFKLEHEAQVQTQTEKKVKPTTSANQLVESKGQTAEADKNEPFIGFEQVPELRGFDRLEGLYQAIQAKKVLHIFYKPFGSTSQSLILHPYFLKEYNNRWFLYGLHQDEEKILPYALDRIERIETSNLPFLPNQKIQPYHIDFGEFFKNRIGITYFEGDKAETIRIKVAQPRAQYIVTKPWHHSQTRVEETPQYGVFEFDLVLNKELEALILSFGKDVEVLGPQWFRTQIQKVLIEALGKY